MGMVISLSMARLLTGLALFVQHPGKTKIYWPHLGWVLFMFLFLIYFWWWEYRLHTVPVIDFGVYLFVIVYCCIFFFLCPGLSGHLDFPRLRSARLTAGKNRVTYPAIAKNRFLLRPIYKINKLYNLNGFI